MAGEGDVAGVGRCGRGEGMLQGKGDVAREGGCARRGGDVAGEGDVERGGGGGMGGGMFTNNHCTQGQNFVITVF